MNGRVVNVLKVLDAIGVESPAPVLADVAVQHQEDVRHALDALRVWRGELISEPPPGGAANPAWSPEKLAYAFKVRAAENPASPSDDLVLDASRYRNGELDWHSFSYDVTPAPSSPETAVFLPTGITFAGMPNRRWWAFEDGRTDFGALDVATTDLTKLALMEFALVYSDDWFMYPLMVPAGSVTRIQTLRVTDSFGKPKDIMRARTPGTSPWNRWEVFTLTPSTAPRAAGHEGILLVPPATGFREESEPLELVRLARDEGANKVWGIERTILNALGDPVSGDVAHRERKELHREDAGTAPPAANPGTALTEAELALMRYRLSTTVPGNWIPYAPVRAKAADSSFTRAAADATSIRLRRARMLLSDESAMSELLTGAGSPTWLNEETVLRAGISLQLTRQRVRWTDGKTYVWLGRGVRIGRGEASSGLRFDLITEAGK
jgi:hypothetical protein